jgi:hypothetical protein
MNSFYSFLYCFFFFFNCFRSVTLFSTWYRYAEISRFSPRVEEKSPLTFTGGKQEFLCEIGLFRRLPGTSLFSQRIGPGSAVELGEEVQLRSIVRSNDGRILIFLGIAFYEELNLCSFYLTGWFYSKLTDVVVRRLKKQTSTSNDGSAILVLQDGCRNPAYRVRFSFGLLFIYIKFPE